MGVAQQVAQHRKAVVVLPPGPSPREFADRISAAWRKAAESIFETGRLLIEAKNCVEKGQFQRMVLCDLPFDPATARRLMGIARHPILSQHIPRLPPHWRILDDLARVPDNVLRRGFSNGTISPRTTTKDVAVMRGTRPSRKGGVGRSFASAPIGDIVNFMQRQIEGTDRNWRPELIGRLRQLLNALEALDRQRAPAPSLPAVVEAVSA